MYNVLNFLYEVKTGWKVETRPGNYGWYHIMWLCIMVITAFLLCYFFGKRHDKKVDNKVIFSFGVFLFLIELYKQVFYWLEAGYFRWYAFPFQFCSVPMYIALIAPWVKKEKIQEAMYCFLAFYGFLAGFAVMMYPDTCFSTDYLTILIHTMVWHSSMAIMGVYLIVARGYGKNPVKEAIPGFFILLSLIAFSILVNVVGYYAYFGTPKNVHGEQLFFMYLSPWYGCPFPILGTIKEQAPYIVFLLCYIVAFAMGIVIVWSAVFGIRKLVTKCQNKNKKEEVTE